MSKSKSMALCGVLAALALVILCLGGMIPLATYVCPTLCTIITYIVFACCGKRLAWTWYAAVAILGMLLGPDKEGAAVFVLLGYYPMLKPVFEKSRLSAIWKLLLFNGAVTLLYCGLVYLLGLEETLVETEALGLIGLSILLVLGNAVFFTLDMVLSMLEKKRKRK